MAQQLNPDTIFIEEMQILIAEGNEAAFRQLFNSYANRLEHFAYAILKNKEGATDVIDEVFIKIWSKKEALLNIHNLTTYLYTAVKNASLNYLAKKTSEPHTDAFDFINIELNAEERPDQMLISAEIFSKIKKAIDELPPKCKIIFKLVREDGLKYKQVAEILSISEKTVDAQMVIAVKKIGESVESYFDYFPSRFKKNKKFF